MTDVFELSYSGSPKGLMEYIKKNTPKCDICNDEGHYEKTEWPDEGHDYTVEVRCLCQED